MSKDANAGELRTPIIVESYSETRNANGYKIKVWANVFGENRYLKVKWANLHGAEVFEAMSLNLKEPATLTSRYTPLLTETCRILKKSDEAQRDALLANGKEEEADNLYFEVISLDNVEEMNDWLEIKVQRKVSAR